MRSLQFFYSSVAKFAAPGLVAVAIVGGFTTRSFAGPIVTNAINDLHDQDYENVYHYVGPGSATNPGTATDADLSNASNYAIGGSGTGGTGGTLAAGDILVAMVRYGDVNGGASLPPGELSAVSVLQLAGGSGTSAAPYTFTAASSDTWQAVTGSPAPTAGTVGQVYENLTTPTFVTNANGNAPGTGSNTNLGAIAGDISSVTSGTLLWNVGFTGAHGTMIGVTASGTGNTTVAANSGIGEGWQAFANSNPNVYSTNNSFDGATSLLYTGAGQPGLGYVGDGPFHTSPGLFNLGEQTTGVQVHGSLITGNPYQDFEVTSQGDYFANVVPEPGSLTLVGFGLASFAGAHLRRRKAKLAA